MQLTITCKTEAIFLKNFKFHLYVFHIFILKIIKMHFWLAKRLTVNSENKNLRVIQIRFKTEENATIKQFCTIFTLTFKRQEYKETERNEK